MKRPGSSDSFSALMIPTDEHNQANNSMYVREFQTMLEGLEDEAAFNEEANQVMEKKRRLGVDQVKALEKNFEVENKLDPERKLRLAQELDLQPRQVAVWFQNRRARWKTKQLERDHGVLKANFDALKQNFEKLHHENEALVKEIQDLKSKLKKEEDLKPVVKREEEEEEKMVFEEAPTPTTDSSPTAAISSSDAAAGVIGETPKPYNPNLVKIEEHDDFLSEDSCTTFFSDDQAPTLHWYSSDDWS